MSKFGWDKFFGLPKTAIHWYRAKKVCINTIQGQTSFRRSVPCNPPKPKMAPDFFKGCPGLGSKPGIFFISLIFSIHHFTAEPQRLPRWPRIDLLNQDEVKFHNAITPGPLLRDVGGLRRRSTGFYSTCRFSQDLDELLELMHTLARMSLATWNPS
jgi:hypothetical protein